MRKANNDTEGEAAMSSVLASSGLLYFTERGEGPPLLLVHGLMVTGEMFEPVIEHLACTYLDTHRRVLAGDGRIPRRLIAVVYTFARAEYHCTFAQS